MTAPVPEWDEPRLARAAIGWLAEPGDRAVGRLVRAVGPVAALRRMVAGTAPDKVRSATIARLTVGDPLELARETARHATRLGCRLVIPEDDEWPYQVDDLIRVTPGADDRDTHTDPPIGLWVRGPQPLTEALRNAVAIVGARAATPYGNHLATELSYGLAERGWTVVSGGAFGIDAAAHRGALAATGTTAAILACGVDVSYPAAHANLFERIGTDGLLISEWSPGSVPHRHRFLIRNRVIAALCRGTVVVEASARSGARNTAKRTRQLGRALMAVPGPTTSTMSLGPHLLIRHEDARLVTSAAEVLEEVGRIGDDLAPIPRGETTPRDQLGPLATRVLDAVPFRRPRTPEDIAVEARISATEVRRTLPMLALLGLIEETPTGYRLPRPAST